MNTPVYDPRIQKWLFPRQRRAPEAFCLFPKTKLPEEIVKEYPDHTPNVPTIDRYHVRREVKQVLGGSSTLPLLNDLIEESQVIAASARVADPSIGQLLAFGTISGSDQDHDRIYPVAGFVRGPGGTDFCVSKMTTETRTIVGLKDMELVIPRIADPHASPLHRFTTPIRQICFGGNPYQHDVVNPRVAVRAAGMTKIFKVVRLGSKTSLFLQPLLTVLPNHADGTAEHADVAWNPYYDRQFGTIDQRGYWKLWDIEGAYRPYERNCGINGKLSASGRVANASDEIGWGKMIWGAEPTTVLVCDRKTIMMCDVRSNPATTKNVSLPLDRDKNFILDIQRVPNRYGDHDAFVLTSANITWVDTRFPGRPLLSVPHNRHKDDPSLHMDLLNTSSSTSVIIGSRLNPIISTFQFAKSDDQTETPKQIGDPFLLASPSSVQTTGPSCTTFLPCTFQKRGGRYDEEAADTTMDDDEKAPEVSWFLGMSVSKNLGIERRIYSTKKGIVSFGKNTLFKPTVINSRGTKEPLKSEEADEDEERDPDERQMFVSRTQRIYADVKKHKIQQIREEFPSHIRIDLPQLYKQIFLTDQDNLKTAQENSDDENSTSSTIAKIASELEKRAENTTLGIASLAEIRLPSRLFDDLSFFESKIHELLDSPEIKDVYDLKPLLSPLVPPPHLAPWYSLPNAKNNKPIPLSTLYNSLITSRLTPLPASVPPRVRLRRERLARQIATEYFLSSLGISIKPTPEDLVAPPMPPSQFAASQDLPTQQEKFKEPIKLLRSFANITPRIHLLTDLRSVVDTWNIGQNPEEFVWDETGMDGRPRMKKDRKKEREERREERRRERRKERERSLVGGSQPASEAETERSRVVSIKGVQSQPAGVGGGLLGLPPLRRVVTEVPLSSQNYGFGAGGVGSSQMPMSSQGLTMSQAVPGKFGGKTAAKKGKRKKGF